MRLPSLFAIKAPPASGPLRQRESLAGLTRRYQYDNLGQLLQQDDSRRGVRGYRYDAAGRLLIAQQPGLRETFVFDPAHNLIDQAQHSRDNRPVTDGAIRNAYDALGRLSGKTGQDKILHLCWDNDGQLIQSKVVEPANTAQTGRQTTVTCYAYDPFGRRLAKWNQPSRHSRRTRTHYGWDGNRLLEEDDGEMVRTYLYRPDSFEPLAQVTRRSGPPPAIEAQEQDPQEAFEAQLHSLLADPDQPQEARQALRASLGEQAIREKTGIGGIALRAAQAKENTLHAREKSAASKDSTAGCDLAQAPIEQAVLPPLKSMQIAGITFQAVTPVPDMPATPETETRPEKNQYNIKDDPLDWQPLRLPEVIERQGILPTPPRSPGDIEIYYYHNDHLGTPQEVTNEAGEILWQGQYKAWGGLINAGEDAQNAVRQRTTGQWREREQPSRQMPAFHQPLRFQGQYHDDETGLHYNRFRYYDPEVGRFVSQDPIGLAGGTNLYQYAPSPTSWIDPLGLSCVSLGLTSIKQQLARAKSAMISVGSKAEAEEILLAMTTGGPRVGNENPAGYRNTTDQIMPNGPKNSNSDWIPEGRGAYDKKGTYHWDKEDPNAKRGDHACMGNHLQIHDFSGKVIRIFY